jgi:hypothetical protein
MKQHILEDASKTPDCKDRIIRVQSVAKKTIAPNASNPPTLCFGVTSPRRRPSPGRVATNGN